MFKIVHNILPEDLLEELITKYCADTRNYEDHWYITNFTKSPLDHDDFLKICNHLATSEHQFAKHIKYRTHKYCCVNKIEPGGALPPHYDTVRHSITLFLNNINTDQGGEFYWHDDDNVVHNVTPVKNSAVIEFLDQSTTNHVHGVHPLKYGKRYSIQLFFGLQSDDKINIGVTPEWVDISKYKYIGEQKL